MGGAEREEESLTSPTSPSPSSSNPTCSPHSPSSFHREAFRKAVTSKSLRRFLEVFMETQMFTGFIQERDLRRQGLRGTGLGFVVVAPLTVLVYTDFAEKCLYFFQVCLRWEHKSIWTRFLGVSNEASTSSSRVLVRPLAPPQPHESVSLRQPSYKVFSVYFYFFQGTRWNSFPRNDAPSQDVKVWKSKMFAVLMKRCSGDVT